MFHLGSPERTLEKTLGLRSKPQGSWDCTGAGRSHARQKHIEENNLTRRNDGLRETCRKRTEEKNTMQSCDGDQIARLQFFDEALESPRLRLNNILKEWNVTEALLLIFLSFLVQSTGM